MIEIFAALLRWGPQVSTLIKVLDGGKVTPEEATDTILKLEEAAVEAALRARFEGVK